MKLIVDTAQPFAADMCIDLSGRDLAVPEHELNRAQISTPFQHVGGKRMAQNVRTDLERQARFNRILLEKLPKTLAGEGLSQPGQE